MLSIRTCLPCLHCSWKLTLTNVTREGIPARLLLINAGLRVRAAMMPNTGEIF